MLAVGIIELTQELLWAACEELFEEIQEKQTLKNAMMEILLTETDAAVHARSKKIGSALRYMDQQVSEQK
jgi:hypothetical protein